VRALELLYYCFPRVVHAARVWGNDNYEEHMELLPALCRQDRLSIDVGAKTGMYTRRMVKHSRTTVAFEPTPVLAHMLKRVFRNKATIEPVALSDRVGSVILRTPYDHRGKVRYGLSTIEPQNRLAGPSITEVGETTVQTRRLDDFEFQGVGFIKIDVEGHEMCVLRGGRETLVREKPNLLIEAREDHCAGAVPDLCDWLSDLGYRGHFLRDHQLVEAAFFDLETDQRRDGTENFIFVHEGSDAVLEALRELSPAGRRFVS
jgi:FkbM family methyltransferase